MKMTDTYMQAPGRLSAVLQRTESQALTLLIGGGKSSSAHVAPSTLQHFHRTSQRSCRLLLPLVTLFFLCACMLTSCDKQAAPESPQDYLTRFANDTTGMAGDSGNVSVTINGTGWDHPVDIHF